MKWQEVKRNDVERAFCVLKSKFQCLERPSKFWDLKDFINITHTCVILHNICVEQCMKNNQVGHKYFYDTFEQVTSDYSEVSFVSDFVQNQDNILFEQERLLDKTNRAGVCVVNEQLERVELVRTYYLYFL